MTFQKQVQLPKRRVVLEHRALEMKYSERKVEAVSHIISVCVCNSCTVNISKVACLLDQCLGRRTLNNERSNVMTGGLFRMWMTWLYAPNHSTFMWQEELTKWSCLFNKWQCAVCPRDVSSHILLFIIFIIEDYNLPFKWVGNIKTELKEIEWETVDRFHLAHDKDLWRAVVNTVMNLRLP